MYININESVIALQLRFKMKYKYRKVNQEFDITWGYVLQPVSFPVWTVGPLNLPSSVTLSAGHLLWTINRPALTKVK